MKLTLTLMLVAVLVFALPLVGCKKETTTGNVSNVPGATTMPAGNAPEANVPPATTPASTPTATTGPAPS